MKMLNYDDPENTNFQRASELGSKQLRELDTLATGDTLPEEMKVTKLANGVRVLSLTHVQPSVIDLGVMLDMGTRDETIETSGTMLALKNTFLKTAMNTNETVNYGMVQMSGGDLSMDYD